MDIEFEAFFREKLSEVHMSLKKLSELTSIPLSHLEKLNVGNFKELPPSPYLRGYLMKIGRVLNFDGEGWWKRLEIHGLIKNSGAGDQMPQNRFTQKIPVRFVWGGIILAIVLVYFGFRFPIIFGKPEITISYPESALTTANVSQVTLMGHLENGDRLLINNEDVQINKDGSWQKTVVLQNGLNTFEIDAKKLLGRETKMIRQIMYESPHFGTSTPSSATP